MTTYHATRGFWSNGADETACTHRGRVRDSDDETVCLECDRRFSSMDALARDGGWDLSDPGREATDG